MTHFCSDFVDTSEEILVERALGGNLAAYDEIIRRYQQNIAASLYRFCANNADLEDVVQETFIRAYDKLGKWTPQAPLVNWIRRIGYNLCYDNLRKQKRNPLARRVNRRDSEEEGSDFELEIADETVRVDVQHANNDLVIWLLDQLKADEAMVITMMYLDQLSVHEIGERTGWGASKIKVKVHRIRKKLKHLFETNEGIKLQYATTTL